MIVGKPPLKEGLKDMIEQERSIELTDGDKTIEIKVHSPEKDGVVYTAGNQPYGDLDTRDIEPGLREYVNGTLYREGKGIARSPKHTQITPDKAIAMQAHSVG